jgi:hypothetical protein
MNKRRRAGRGAVSIEVLRRYEVKDKRYTWTQFKADQESLYHQRLRDWGFDFEEDQDED